MGFDIEVLLNNEEMRKKLKNISEAHRRYLEKIASGEWEVW